MLTSKKESKKKKDIVTMYRNCSKSLEHISMDEYFYHHFCKEFIDKKSNQIEATKHRILLPAGQNCKPHYPVTYEYAKGVFIQYKPLLKDKPLTNLLKNNSRTIRTFKWIINKKQFPSCVRNQYILSMKYLQKANLEFLNKQSVQQPYNLSNMDDEERDTCIARQN